MSHSAAVPLPDVENGKIKIKTLLSAVSIDIIKSKANGVSFTESAVNADSLGYRQYLTAILLAGPEIHLTFMIHFFIDEVAELVGSISGLEPSKVETWRSVDFFKELCNIVAGRVKKEFKERGIAVDQSLPLATSGFNLALLRGPGIIDSTVAWSQNASNVSLDFSAHYRCLEKTIHPKILKLPDSYDFRVKKADIEFF